METPIGLINWSKFNWDSKKDRDILKVRVNEFLQAPMRQDVHEAAEVLRHLRAQVKEFTTSADFPTSVLQIFQKYHLTNDFDDGYLKAFKTIDITNSRRNGIEISDVQDALVFAKVIEGLKAKVYQASGTKISVTCDMYGGGLSWSRRLIDDEEYWTLEDNAITFRNKFYYSKAANFYALIAAVGAGQNVAWQQPLPVGLLAADATYVANRDAQTLNAALINLLNDNANKGYGVSTSNIRPIVIHPIELTGRLRMALSLTLQHYGTSEPAVQGTFELVPTTMLANKAQYYVILPGNKLVHLERMPMQIFSDFDILSYSDLAIAWARYGGAIADQQQVRRCATV